MHQLIELAGRNLHLVMAAALTLAFVGLTLVFVIKAVRQAKCLIMTPASLRRARIYLGLSLFCALLYLIFMVLAVHMYFRG